MSKIEDDYQLIKIENLMISIIKKKNQSFLFHELVKPIECYRVRLKKSFYCMKVVSFIYISTENEYKK